VLSEVGAKVTIPLAIACTVGGEVCAQAVCFVQPVVVGEDRLRRGEHAHTGKQAWHVTLYESQKSM